MQRGEVTQGWPAGRACLAAGDRMLCCKHLLTIFFFFSAPLSFGVCCRRAGREGVSGELVFGKGNFLSLGPQGALAAVTPSLPDTRLRTPVP